jgi:hypothetical protein
MSADSRSQDLSAPDAPRTGSFIDHKTRSVQQMNGSPNCLGVNLSEVGAAVLGVSKQDDVSIVVFENGIWIPQDD